MHEVIGAGPAGLAAAITFARAGELVRVSATKASASGSAVTCRAWRTGRAPMTR